MSLKILHKLSLAIVLLLVANPLYAGERDPALAGFFAAPLVIESASGNKHRFTVYLAITPYQRAHGLMYVRSLPADYGMLFIHEQPKIASMWMKNTVLPLDMLFVRADGTVSNIAYDTVPGSLESVSSSVEVIGVLELNAGTAKRLKLAPGDKIIHSAFKSDVSDAESPTSDRR